MATHLKDELNRKYNGDWHCFVGRNFGSYVTYEAKHYIYFYLGQYGFLLFKTVKSGWFLECDFVICWDFMWICYEIVNKSFKIFAIIFAVIIDLIDKISKKLINIKDSSLNRY